MSSKQNTEPQPQERRVLPFPGTAEQVPEAATLREFLEGEPLFLFLRRYWDWSNVPDWAFYLAGALGLGGLLLLLALLLLLEIRLESIL